MDRQGIAFNLRSALAVFASAVLLIVFVLYVISNGVSAGSVNYSASGQNSYSPAPYTGGGSVSKVFYPADGSTITITDTGAVIKQSPGGNAYRQGWIDPTAINSIYSAADLNGRLMNGQANPYTKSSGQYNYPPANKYGSNVKQSYNQAYSNTSSSASAYSSSSATASASPAVKSANYTQASSAPTNNTLPNTGSGSVLAVGSLAAVFGTIGHFIYQRLRYR
ncbi:MAG TPA: hypothetical protein VFW52_00420 [Candidatus Saccharimonadales bacterium]|nr:hypothetical protein [Candidatus Saccharimonadales bacterium]